MGDRQFVPQTMVHNSGEESFANTPDRQYDNLYQDSRYLNNDLQTNQSFVEGASTRLEHVTPADSKAFLLKQERLMTREKFLSTLPQNLTDEV